MSVFQDKALLIMGTIDKYQDHLSLHCQIDILRRSSIG